MDDYSMVGNMLAGAGTYRINKYKVLLAVRSLGTL